MHEKATEVHLSKSNSLPRIGEEDLVQKRLDLRREPRWVLEISSLNLSEQCGHGGLVEWKEASEQHVAEHSKAVGTKERRARTRARTG